MTHFTHHDISVRITWTKLVLHTDHPEHQEGHTNEPGWPKAGSGTGETNLGKQSRQHQAQDGCWLCQHDK